MPKPFHERRQGREIRLCSFRGIQWATSRSGGRGHVSSASTGLWATAFTCFGDTATTTNFEKPWFFIYMRHARVDSFYFALKFVD
jgi:hypothetical protein